MPAARLVSCCTAVVPQQQVGAFTVDRRGRKVIPTTAGGLIMTTSLWPEPCAKKYGDLINQLSIVNKVRSRPCADGGDN